MRLSIVLLLALTLWANAGAETFRYTQPPLGRLVFNELLTGETTAPLRLPKIGEYYAELILEAPDGTTDVVLREPLAVDLEVNVARREHALLKRTVKVSFAPGERTKTLFWLNVPNHLPNRTNLEMHVSLREPSTTQFADAKLRLQLTRKIEFSPVFVR